MIQQNLIKLFRYLMLMHFFAAQTSTLHDIQPSKFLCQKRELDLTKWQRDKCEKSNQRHTYAAAIQVNFSFQVIST